MNSKNQIIKNYNILIMLLALFSLFGIIDSVYLAVAHYKPSSVDFCSGLKGGFECDVVNTSDFSTIDGVINFFLGTELSLPVPFAMLSGFLFTLTLISALLIYRRSSFRIFSVNITYIFIEDLCQVLLVISLFFGGFLIYTQAYLIMAWCILCIILDVIILSVNIIFFLMKIYRKKHAAVLN